MMPRGLCVELIASVMCLMAAACVAAEKTATRPEGKKEVLWPNGTPGALGDKETDKPSLTVFPAPPEKATGAALIVCPGGGYGGLAIDHEGYQVVEWLNAEGISAFLLRYRVAPYRHPAPLQDAQRAVRTVRARAGEWNIDPARIGMLGFSAAGHLVSTAGTHFDNGNPASDDPIERVGSRPDFIILIYPVITFKPPYAHMGSRNNLIGENPDPALIDNLSNNEQVNKDTPPAFLVHTGGDTGVPAENSVLFYLALRKAGVPAEMHLYEKGEHGFGLGGGDPVLSTWPKHCLDWLRGRGILPSR